MNKDLKKEKTITETLKEQIIPETSKEQIIPETLEKIAGGSSPGGSSHYSKTNEGLLFRKDKY